MVNGMPAFNRLSPLNSGTLEVSLGTLIHQPFSSAVAVRVFRSTHFPHGIVASLTHSQTVLPPSKPKATGLTDLLQYLLRTTLRSAVERPPRYTYTTHLRSANMVSKFQHFSNLIITILFRIFLTSYNILYVVFIF